MLHRKALKGRWMISGALGALGMAMATPGLAQEAPATKADNGAPQTENSALESVVVTGTRRVISTPEQIKRSNTGVVDSVTASQVDLSTDQSLPELLDRVVGVSSDIGYQTSQAQYVTVRGFDSRYNSAEVDGNPIWNSSRNNRGAQLDMFPSTSVSQINVYKTVTPDQDPNSIGGHIELRTLRAFDGGDQPYFKLRMEGGGYEQGREEHAPGQPSYLLGAVGKNTFGSDHQYGFVLGADFQQDSWHDRYNTVTAFSQINNTDVVNGSLFQGIYDDTITRTGLYGKLEAHATDKFYSFLSASFYEERENNQEFRTGPFLTAFTVTGASQNVGNFSKSAEESYLETYIFNRQEVLIGSGLDYRINNHDQINVRASYTNYYDYEDDQTGERFEAPVVAGSYRLSDTFPSVTLAPAAALSDPSNWIYRNKNASAQKILPNTDNVYSLTADYSANNYTGAQGLGFTVGGGFRRLDRNFNQTVNNYTLPTGVTANLGQFLPAGTSLNGTSAAFIDPELFWRYVEQKGVLSVDPSQSADYHLVEDVYSGYAEAVYGWRSLHGLAGFRVEQTQSTDQTSNKIGAVFTPETYNVHYTNWMPNVQVGWDATEKLRFRASFTETIARPDFKDYAMGQTITTDANGNPVISGTNPHLTPREATNYDLSSEYYGHDFFLSAAIFHKVIKKDEFNQQFQQTNAAGTVILTETIPLNSGTAYDDGVELNYVQNHAPWLPDPLKGLHWNLNYTRLVGVWDVNLSNGAPRTVDGLRNQPKWLGNVGVGYTLGPLDVNMALRLRGQTFTGAFGVTPAGDVWINPYSRVDLQVNYKVRPGLDLFFDARNLNDAYWSQTTGVQNSLSTSINPGRAFFFGFKYKPGARE